MRINIVENWNVKSKKIRVGKISAFHTPILLKVAKTVRKKLGSLSSLKLMLKKAMQKQLKKDVISWNLKELVLTAL